MKKVLLASALGLVLAASAQAQEGFYALGALGISHTTAMEDLMDDAAAFGDEIGSGYSLKADTGSLAGKIVVGYQVNDYFAVEGGYYHLGQFSMKGSVGSLKGKVDASTQGFVLDAVGSYPIFKKVSVFGKAGFGLMRTEVKDSIEVFGESGSDKISKTRLVPKLGFGAEYNIMDNLAIRGEYERFFNTAKESEAGMIKMSHNLFTVGVKYTF